MTIEEYGIQWTKQVLKKGYVFSGRRNFEEKFIQSNADLPEDDLKRSLKAAWEYYQNILSTSRIIIFSRCISLPIINDSQRKIGMDCVR